MGGVGGREGVRGGPCHVRSSPGPPSYPALPPFSSSQHGNVLLGIHDCEPPLPPVGAFTSIDAEPQGSTSRSAPPAAGVQPSAE